MKRLLMGLAVGAGAMYLLDPDHGAERRAKLLGFYGDNKDTIQDYAHTAAQTAVTVGSTAASTAADKASELTGKGKEDRSEPSLATSSPAKSANGKASGSTPPADAPGMGGSLST